MILTKKVSSSHWQQGFTSWDGVNRGPLRAADRSTHPKETEIAHRTYLLNLTLEKKQCRLSIHPIGSHVMVFFPTFTMKCSTKCVGKYYQATMGSTIHGSYGYTCSDLKGRVLGFPSSTKVSSSTMNGR